MVQIILAQLRWQQAMEESGLAAALSANQRGHALVAMQGIHLQPVGHSRSQPRCEKSLLLRGDARQTAEELCDVVLTVPCWQTLHIVTDGIVGRHILRMHKLHNLRLRTALLADALLLGPADDAVERLLGQRAENWCLGPAVGFVGRPFGRLG